jgi:hypothetical protein
LKFGYFEYIYLLINTDIKLIYPQLIDWDQRGPPTLDCFENDKALSEFMGLRNNMPLGDHKVGFEVVLDTQAYYGETIDSLSRKIENMKLIS